MNFISLHSNGVLPSFDSCFMMFSRCGLTGVCFSYATFTVDVLLSPVMCAANSKPSVASLSVIEMPIFRIALGLESKSSNFLSLFLYNAVPCCRPVGILSGNILLPSTLFALKPTSSLFADRLSCGLPLRSMKKQSPSPLVKAEVPATVNELLRISFTVPTYSPMALGVSNDAMSVFLPVSM